MVSIVIVSHSPSLAQGVFELVEQMTQGKIKIAVAAGVDDIDNPIGTDAMAIMQAVEDVYSASGVLLMVDMGSAILSAEMALEFIEPEKAENVHICAAPIVEGTMSAAVAAASGLPITAVIDEAHGALFAKYELLNQSHLLAGDSNVAQHFVDASLDDNISFSWLVKNAHGLHARPSAAIVSAIADVEAEAKLYLGDKVANAKSLNSIALLGVKQGDTITLSAKGRDAKALVKQFSDLAEAGFGESINTQHCASSITGGAQLSKIETGCLMGAVVYQGIATGPAVIFKQEMPKFELRCFISQTDEVQLLHRAITQVADQIQLLKSLPYACEEMNNIFDAHLMMLTDDELLDDIVALISKQYRVEQAVFETINRLAKEFRETTSTYMQAREADIWDLGRQLMYALCGGLLPPKLNCKEPSIIFSDVLSPSNTAKLDPKLTLAICLSDGDIDSHSALLAKAMKIPTLFKVENCLQKVKQGQHVCVDGNKGQLDYNPKEKNEPS